MPHSSASGTPIAWKKTSTSRGVGAAPTLTAAIWSKPSIARICENSASSACATVAARSSGHRFPGLLELDLALRGVEHRLLLLAALARGQEALHAGLELLPDRGTAKNQVGLTVAGSRRCRAGSGRS
jgi:hypothetical protein